MLTFLAAGRRQTPVPGGDTRRQYHLSANGRLGGVLVGMRRDVLADNAGSVRSVWLRRESALRTGTGAGWPQLLACRGTT
jgi:hypothetical protein